MSFVGLLQTLKKAAGLLERGHPRLWHRASRPYCSNAVL